MKRTYLISQFTLLLAGILLLGLSQSGKAGGTTAGTDVTSTATAAYSVNSQDYTKDSNEVLFKVDRKIDLTVVTTDTAAVAVLPAEKKWLSFTVTNSGNCVIDASLAADALVGIAARFTGTDNKDIAATENIFVFVDTNDDDAYVEADDTDTAIDNLAIDDSIKVFIVATADTDLVDGDIASYYLTATALDSDGNALTATGDTVADTAGTMDTVFADDDGPNDNDRDAKDSDYSDFIYSTSNLTVTKEALTIWDPVNETTYPKAIPGAKVKYTVIITNAADAAPSILTDITDILLISMDADTDDDTVTVAVTNSARATTASSTKKFTDLGVTDSSPGIAGGTLTFGMADLLPAETIGGDVYAAGELKGGETVTITYNVIIQ
jgi:hypothetical protein